MKLKERTIKRKEIICELIEEHGLTKKKYLYELIRSTPEYNKYFLDIKKRMVYYLIEFACNNEDTDITNSDTDEVEVKTESKTSNNSYKKKFVLSAWNTLTGQMMDIDSYCDHYKLPRKDINSYKLVSHTGTPYYNIVFKETFSKEVEEFDFEGIIAKYVDKVAAINNVSIKIPIPNDFDTLTYTDVHIGMDTNSDNNSMYATMWDKDAILTSAIYMVSEVIANKNSNKLVIDELGDFLDGFDGYTTRGGHKLPQNMTNEEAFDCGLEFKMLLLDTLAPYFEELIFNNICNDNHSGAFGYFVNSAFKQIAEKRYPGKVTVTNHRQFINHYYVNDICYIISHGKDDKTLKFGFKVQLESKGLEKIDQYCKQNGIYAQAKKIVFKKGDSHQALFDMATSDDFFYFNYPALSPSSQWVQNNFKKGRRGFVLETSKDMSIDMKIKFITK